MKKIFILLSLLLLLMPFAKAQKSETFLLINNGKKYKKLYVSKLNECFRLGSTIKLENGLDSTNYFLAHFKGISAGKLKFEVKNHIITVGNCDTSTQIKHWYGNFRKEMDFDIESIDDITHQTDRQANWEVGGYFTLSVGILTSLVIAPLISINYKNGNFNKDRYYKTAALGIGMVGISIPITVISRKKTYIFKFDKDKPNDKVWKIINRN